MNKSTLFLLIIGLTLLQCNTNKNCEKNDLNKENLKGDIIATNDSLFNCQFKFGKLIIENLESIQQVKINVLGNIEKVDFWDNSTNNNLTDFLYDSLNLNIRKLKYRMTIFGQNLITQSDYKYDNLSNPIEELVYDSIGDLIGKTNRIYDENGNCIKETVEELGKISKTEFSYNSEGFVKNKKTEYTNLILNNTDRIVISGRENRYLRNEDNYVLIDSEFIKFDSDPSPILTFIRQYDYKYDNVGNWITQHKTEEFKLFNIKNRFSHTLKRRTITYSESGNILDWFYKITDKFRLNMEIIKRILMIITVLLWFPSLYLIPKYIGVKRHIGWKWSLFFTISLTWIGGLFFSLLSMPLKKSRKIKTNKILGLLFVFVLVMNLYMMTKDDKNFNFIGFIINGGLIIYCFDRSKDIKPKDETEIK